MAISLKIAIEFETIINFPILSRPAILKDNKLMDSFWGNIFKKNGEPEGVHALLRKVMLFTNLSDRELALVERLLHQRNYKPGEEIFREGEPGVSMYIIEKGTVIITVGSPQEKTLAELHDGEFFGELALLDESPRSASAIAKTECSIVGFGQPDLFGIIERNPRLGVKIVETLARIIGERLKKTNEQLQSLSKH
jgi:CRP-like cAMP-binding protein